MPGHFLNPCVLNTSNLCIVPNSPNQLSAMEKFAIYENFYHCRYLPALYRLGLDFTVFKHCCFKQ